MALILKQSTAVDVLIGPFVDLTDGATAEEGESPSVLLSKNGQALAAKNDVTTPVHDDAGYYNCELDATDTNTVGQLVIIIEKSASALPVRHEFLIVEEATYDFLFAAGATPIADINAEVDTALTDYDAVIPADLNDPTAAVIAAAVWDEDATGHQTGGTFGEALGDPTTSGNSVRDLIAALNDLSAAAVNAEVDTALADFFTSADNLVDLIWDELQSAHVAAGSFGELATEIASILADSNELQTDWADGGRLDLLIDAIKAVTDNLPNSGALSDLATILADTADMQPKLGTPAGASIAADIAALLADILDKVGAVNETAADGDPSSTESVMQYIKQIVNILVGTAGIVSFPAEAAPANAVSLAEVIRAIHADVTGLAGTTAAAIADAVWDEVASGHVTAATFGALLQLGRSNTAQGGAAGSITLDASASATDDQYNEMICVIVSGTGAGQARRISDYAGSTKIATVSPNWAVVPDNTSVFIIIGN